MSDSKLTQATIYPGITYDDPAAAIAWLSAAFGFVTRLIVPGPDGGIMHSELSLGEGGVIMIGGPRPDEGRFSPKSLNGLNMTLSAYVEDPDEHFEQAKAHGAKILRDVQDEHFGCRGYMAEDLEGNRWYFGTYKPGLHWDQESDSSA